MMVDLNRKSEFELQRTRRLPRMDQLIPLEKKTTCILAAGSHADEQEKASIQPDITSQIQSIATA